MPSFALDKITDAGFIARLMQDAIFKIIGDTKKKIKGVAALEYAQSRDLAFCSAKEENGAAKINDSNAGIIFCHESVMPHVDFDIKGRTFFIVEDPMLQFNRCLKHFFSANKKMEIHDSVILNKNCNVHDTVSVGPHSVIGNRVAINADSTISSCVIVCDGVSIGKNVSIGPNSSIGIEGLAYATNEHGRYEHFMHLGSVIIKDNVDIGANTCIVRGILQNTCVGKGTKIGNHVNIGHNVTIGADCFISAGAVLCGSVSVEDNCWIAPQAAVLNHVRIGYGATVGLGAVVTKDVAPNTIVVGNPAKPIKR